MKKRLIKFFIWLIIIIFVIKIISVLTVWYYSHLGNKLAINKINGKTVFSQNLGDLVAVIEDNMFNEQVTHKEDTSKVTKSQKHSIEVKVSNCNSNSEYYVTYNVNNTENNVKLEKNKNNTIDIDLEEAKNDISINVKRDNEVIDSWNNTIYYYEPYKKQFLDELSSKGVQVHYRDGNWENVDKTGDMLIDSGVKYVRADFILRDKKIKLNNYNFSYYDKWIKKVSNNNIKIIAILNMGGEFFGDDMKINSNEDIEKAVSFAKKIAERYPQIVDYEILNEPNLGTKYYNYVGYTSDEYIAWYSNLIQNVSTELKKINPDINVMTGSLATINNNDTEINLRYDTFFNKIINQGTYKYTDTISYHPYDWNNISKQNEKIYDTIEKVNNIFNNAGGFIKQAVTEYGIASYNNNKVTEDIQASKLVQQTVITDFENADKAILYNFWNVGTDANNIEHNFGLLNNDGTPKKSYYAMKNYYENTNGAVYIGKVDIKEGLEAHVYDKDGKPVIIAWAEDNQNNIELNYKDFNAKDLYGKAILADNNKKITITSSPVYLYDVDYSYFYKAISKTAVEKYNKFKEKFSTELGNIPDILTEINQTQNYIYTVREREAQKLQQETSILAMEKHYNIGMLILNAYKDGKINCDATKISSMLDMLNNIGESYKNLVIVSTNNTINSNMNDLENVNVYQNIMEKTESEINDVSNLIKNSSEVEFIYPRKILEFGIEKYRKAQYVNKLTEQNDIKGGILAGENLNAELLVTWAKEFANIQINKYIDNYINENPVTITYSEQNLTNKDITARIETNADIDVINNSKSKEYIFKENGTFVFEYEIKGRKLSTQAIVNNIDKTSPQILGIKEGQKYQEGVTPQIIDENLSEIKLIKDGEEVKDYKQNTKITQEGVYQLTVKDKAGNETTVNFIIIYPEDERYQIKDKKVTNIKAGTQITKLKEKLQISGNYNIKRNNKELKETEKVVTGDIVETQNGEKYVLIVKGDVNKDGEVNIKDIVKMRKYLLVKNNFDENEKLAADTDLDGKDINIKDLIKMRIIILAGK